MFQIRLNQVVESSGFVYVAYLKTTGVDPKCKVTVKAEMCHHTKTKLDKYVLIQRLNWINKYSRCVYMK